ncbi:MAG: ATP-dependent DNA helicase RecG [Cytophagales bacterium]
MGVNFGTEIKFLKGIGPKRAELFQKELELFTFGDLITHYPYRYEDRTRIYKVSELQGNEEIIQLRGHLKNFKTAGHGRKTRLIADFNDKSGNIELVWFKGVNWVLNKFKVGQEVILFGKPTLYGNKLNIAHPEMELAKNLKSGKDQKLTSLYSSTEKLRRNYLDSRAIENIIDQNLEQIEFDVEILPETLIKKFKLIPRRRALIAIHKPQSFKEAEEARRRLKFEELFLIQLRILFQKSENKEIFPGQIFKKLDKLNTFYREHLPFQLTNAQKKVIKEIRSDLISGYQMNRLLQGDVGSGKTMVAFLCSLMARDNKAQTCIMAPTEILAEQLYNGLSDYSKYLGIRIAKLSGSTKSASRKEILKNLEAGNIDIIIGTHALIEDRVKFKNLGLCVIDEQHRFGVAQRAKLWQKNKSHFPHILVMTATPIPRTLAMTLYGDLDISVIDELPPGRKEIKTVLRTDAHRLSVFKFLKDEIEKGRQIYIVYPLIEESKKLDYKDLMDGFESISRAFPEYPISILHGRMKAADKDYEMQRFVKNETKILVSTTVIEVGVNVPNASVMVIENSEKFGLSQLHQLRGRVGRGAEQSFCILMTGNKVSKDARVRLETMVRTQNGFEIADVDLKLRGPGDLAGTQQSGVLNLKIADLAQDSGILIAARDSVKAILDKDPGLNSTAHRRLKSLMQRKNSNDLDWKLIS